MALIKVQSEGINLADDFTFSGTVSGAGEPNTPIVRAVPSANQTVAYATYATIVFDTEQIDTHSAFTGNTFTVPSGQAGKYFVNLQVVATDASADSLERLNIKINGTDKASGNYYKGASGDHSFILSGIFDLSEGDTIIGTYFTYAGGSATIKSNASYTGGTCIDIFKIAS